MSAAFHTLGCKLNQSETGAISMGFQRAGFRLVQFGSPSDVVVINSCTVTENADRECRQLVRRALRVNPKAFVIVTGCYAQLQPEEIASVEGVDLVVGNAGKHRLLSIESEFRKKEIPRVVVEQPDAGDLGAGFTAGASVQTRAYLKVQDGCDYNCSFCTIPLARGASRSLDADAVVDQARILVGQGFREIILTGVNLGDYSSPKANSLCSLLRHLHAVEGIDRLRISSIEPNLLGNDIIDLVSQSDRLVPHFHIPLQSGSDRILRTMRRRYQTDLYRDRVHAILQRMPDTAIGADVIAGFPGEDEADFMASYDFLCLLPIAYLHVFSYSERENTPAASMASAVPRQERSRRTSMLRSLSTLKQTRFAQRFIGSIRPVLFESVDADGVRGYTDNYIRVRASTHPNLHGTIRSTRLNALGPDCVAGTVVDELGSPIERTMLNV